ncbi:hypothetical protein P170DRAFT_504626 [Aspergillus steynii IBT 23096]|uniref:FUN14-domain-containing protein n=1 Tax=Aspergillus steynii IBT 23096 TaxID=1392250 RepID=A0A2I2GLD5_9EURO|nr:uncharacterized protein P170DRAFT_504626 [Aspergillus steynii IBT 23096]PLB53692.1 hypothetical protein P170DRAFT_504626 [Aspergillus steynii IBT 23096]
MSLLMSRTSAILGVGVGLGLSLSPLSPFRSTPIQCQYAAPYPRATESAESGWAIDGQDPLLRKQGATGPGSSIFTASNMRQVSLGSVLGLVAGVGLRAFSKALVVLLGMGVVLVEWAAAKGYNILPLQKMQRYVKGVDLQKAVSRQIPFKLSFGATMTLAAFAQF